MSENIILTNPNEIIDLTGMSSEVLTLPKTREVIKVVVPTLADIILNKPKMPTYRDGMRKEITHYADSMITNNYGTKELKDYKGNIEDLIVDIGANFKVKPHQLQYVNPITGVLEQMPKYFLFNEATGKILNDIPVSDRYSVLDFDECIRYFYSIIETIRNRGYEVVPDVAKVYDNGNRMFLQYAIYGNKIMGEDYKTNITLLTSHDKVFSFTICLSQVRLFCQNQVSRLLKNCDSQIKIRHTKIAKNAIEAESTRVLLSADNQHKMLGQYLENLATIKVNDQMIYDAWLKMSGIDSTALIPSSTATRLTNRFAEYLACYDMDDVANYKNTALGAYMAMSDYNDHVIPARTTEGYADTKIEDAIYKGNPALSEFIDTLVGIAQ